MTPAELEATHQTLFRLEQRWMAPTPDASVFFAYDPLPIALFLNGLRIAERFARGRRFLDVGCGIGTKLAFMHYLGWTVSGIERHGPYVDAARELCPFAKITEANLLDVESFHADLVYMYRPGVSEETESSLERHVVERMRAGSVLFLPTRDINTDWPVTVVGGSVGVRH